MKVMKKLTSIFNIIGGIGHLVVVLIQAIWTIILAAIFFMLGFFTLDGVAISFLWTGLFSGLILMLSAVIILVCGLILSRKRTANMINLFAGVLCLISTILVIAMNPTTRGTTSPLPIETGDFVPLFSFYWVALAIHSVLVVLYFMKWFFNKPEISKDPGTTIAQSSNEPKIKGPVVFCQFCGQKNPKSNTNCSKCGAKLE